MNDKLTKDRALIFRIVHKDNVDRLLTDGCLCRSAVPAGSPYVEIGNQELIAKRVTREIPCTPGGTLNDYVPFYFTPYTPMLYNIKTGCGVPQKSMDDIVILATSLYRLRDLGIPFVFTDRHAYLRTATFSNNLDELDMIIWDTLRARDFRRSDIEKFEKYQAEALVYKRLPISALLAIICHNESVRDAVQAKAIAAGNGVKVVSKPAWFL